MFRRLTILLTVFFVIIINYTDIHSREFRAAQLPNGSINSCANCHVSPQGGGQLTSFGRTVSDDYLDNSGNVIWSSSLASRDSDGDGFTNGTELQDPEGNWTFGQPGPGDPEIVYNPGDASSKPDISSISAGNYLSAVSISPNPFSDDTAIDYSMKHGGVVSLFIVSTNGEIVKTITGNYLTAGNHRFIWDGKDDNGIDLSAGQYSAVLQFDKKAVVKRIYYLK